MPVRSSSSSLLRWPDREAVHTALEAWAREEAAEEPRLRRMGYFGSYARDEWGVGSDLDVVLIRWWERPRNGVEVVTRAHVSPLALLTRTLSTRSSKRWSWPAFVDAPRVRWRAGIHDGRTPCAVSAGVSPRDGGVGPLGPFAGELSRQFEPSAGAIRIWVKQADPGEGRSDE